ISSAASDVYIIQIANMCIILINQADYLLYRQLKKLSDDFISNGGFSERMSALRRKNRGY
ncbi:MAG: four helix bundle suffix domain-containing protein, partial [Muribaculaceae bacterium]|nr:four helix bundle suffix domain-containing protein [Muribaculaceae bacterium]